MTENKIKIYSNKINKNNMPVIKVKKTGNKTNKKIVILSEEDKINKYMNLLNDFIDSQEEKKEEPINNEYLRERICCDNQELRDDMVMDITTCINCGVCFTREDDVEFGECIRNPKFKMTTTMSYSGGNKYRSIQRIQKWMNYDYKENAANDNYTDIKNICNKLNLPIRVENCACDYYKKVYIDDEITSRDNIRFSMYLVCIHRACLFNEYEVDIFDLLEKASIDIDDYNKAADKIDEIKLLINKDMKKLIGLVKEKYDKELNINDVIKGYNNVLNKLKLISKRLNKNTALCIAIFYLLDSPKKSEFIRNFPISETTLLKFLKKLKTLN